MGDFFLEAKGIVKRFPGTLALDGVNFAVRPGEMSGTPTAAPAPEAAK